MPQLYQIAITATGEVRDADGNLISSTPVESTTVVTEAQLREMGLAPEEESS
jgi:hypothetical protein